DRLAVLLDFLAAERPHQGIGEGRRIAEAVAKRLADRVAVGLELLAGRLVLVPGRGEALEADLLEPGLAIGNLRAEHAPGGGDPFLAVIGDDLGLVVEAALLLADLLDEVGHIDDALGVELRPVVEAADDVRPRARLDRRGGARLDVVAVDHLDGELDAQRLSAFRDDLLAQHLVGGRNEVVPAQPVERGALGIGRGTTGGEDGGDAAGPRRQSTGTGKLQKLAPTNARHDPSSLVWRPLRSLFWHCRKGYDAAGGMSMPLENQRRRRGMASALAAGGRSGSLPSRGGGDGEASCGAVETAVEGEDRAVGGRGRDMGVDDQVGQAAMALAGKGDALADRRLLAEEPPPFPVHAVKKPGLAIAGAAAQKPRPAHQKPVIIAKTEAAAPQLGRPILGGVEAGVLDLGDDLVHFAGRQ